MYSDFWDSVKGEIVFKAFAKKGEIDAILLQILPKNINYSIDFNACDNTVKVDLTTLDDTTKRDIVKKIFNRLDNYIYSEENISLGEYCVKLLKFVDKKLGIAESLTGGMVADALVSIKGASEVLNESLVCYSNIAKMNNLSVKQSTLAVYTAVSSETAYEMVKGVLAHDYNDYAVSTTGYAENYGGENGGTVYIGVGDRGRIDVHKYSFLGDRQEVRRCVTNGALFHLAKKMKGSFN